MSRTTRRPVDNRLLTTIFPTDENENNQRPKSCSRVIANIKGNLINKKFVNRIDLMKLYKLPNNNGVLTEKNPFSNKSFTDNLSAKHDKYFRKMLKTGDHE